MEHSQELEMYETIVQKINYIEIDIPEDESARLCRICMQFDEIWKLINPCHCTGSIKYVHEECLKAWLLSKGDVGHSQCELCHSAFSMDYKLGYKCSFRSICSDKSDYIAIFPLFFVIMAMIVSVILVLVHKSQDNMTEAKRKSIYMFTGSFFLLLIFLIAVFAAVLCRICIKNTIKQWDIFSLQHDNSYVDTESEPKHVSSDDQCHNSSNIRFSDYKTFETSLNGLMNVKAEGSFVYSPTNQHKKFAFRGPNSPQTAKLSKDHLI